MSNENENENGEQGIRIPLDGSFGLGSVAEVTIVTKHGDSMREETFQIPYVIVDTKALEACNRMNLINGYRIVKVTTNVSLKELGL